MQCDDMCACDAKMILRVRMVLEMPIQWKLKDWNKLKQNKGREQKKL
jgi:hypothetical protein